MKRSLFCGVLAACMLLGGCGILPKEEMYQSAPIIQQYQQEQWEFTDVKRGDMVLYQKVICTYMPVKTENLSFSVDGVRFDQMFVSVGDYVTSGQLLAQLDTSDLEVKLEECDLQIRRLTLKIAAVDENRELALERQALLMENSSAEEREAELQKIREEYDRQKQTLQNELDAVYTQVSQYQNRIATRQLRAQIDGTVTYVRQCEQGQYVHFGEQIIRIEDSASSVFRADTRNWEKFVPGQEYQIAVNDEVYTATVVTEAEIGLPETEKVPGTYAYVYLVPNDPSIQLGDSDRGSVMLVLESRENVLMVPQTALVQRKNMTLVYYQDENGMKAYMVVQTGLVADNMVEILSGLEEGERIIAD